jgi:Xaa-Pro aminopeptidase
MKDAVSPATSYLQVRQKSVRHALHELKLDGLLLTHPPDLAYLSHFTGDDSVGLLTGDDFFLVTDFRYKEQAQIEAPWLKVTMREGKMADALAATILNSSARRIGFEANFTPFGQARALEKSLKDLKAGSVELIPVEDVMVNIRKIKDEVEIDIIRKAVAIAQDAYLAVRKQLKVGQTENYLAGLMVIDWGARFKGYCSDLTRTLLLGRVSPKIEKAYKVVLEAQQAAIAFLRPGVTTSQTDRIARDLIAKAGMGDLFGHGLGHGIGLDIHELPTMRKTGGEEELRPGMIVTVEPGVYLPGEGGVRIEDDVLITHAGHEVLSSLDKSFEGCHLE